MEECGRRPSSGPLAMRTASRRQSTLAYLSERGFRVAPSLPLRDHAELRPQEEPGGA